MRILSVLLIASLMQVSAATFGQRITLQQHNVTLESVLKEIRKQSGYDFFYDDKTIPQNEKISISVSNKDIKEALDAALNGLNLDYRILGSVVIITKEEKSSLLNKILARLSAIDVRGKVTDTLGNSLPGATILIKGTNISTSTNQNGDYYLADVPSDGTLVIRYVGFTEKEERVNGRKSIDIILHEDIAGLEEVAVVGFGTQKKQSVVGSQSTIRAEELKAPVRDLTTAIAGRLAGVIATQRGGGPGNDGANLFIRGVSTFTTSPQGPLLVVDGVPDRQINNIDPEDIESFTVLKDATATAVYGTRGANGVILINTRKGKTGKPSINAEFDQALTKFTFLPKFIDAPTYMSLFNEGMTMRGRTSLYTEEAINKHATGEDPDLYPNVDWYNVLFNKAGSNNRATLNVNGGSERARYYVSTGYFGETGLFKNDEIQSYNSTLKLNRFNFTSNMDIDITGSTKLALGVNGYITNLNTPAYGVNEIFDLATRSAPHIIPPQYSNKQWPQLPGTRISPYMALTQSGVSNAYNNAVRSNLRITQDLGTIIPGLSATAMFAFDVNVSNSLNRSRTLQTYWATGRDNDGNLITEISSPGTNELSFSLNRYGDRRFYTESAINYRHQFGVHDVSGMLLFNQSDYSDATAQVNTYKAAIPYRQRNLVGRANYGYNGRYYAEANFSYSGSDNFAPENRYGFFPSFGVGWVVSNEKFFDALSGVINHFKLRYTYGLSGNAGLTDPSLRFLYLTTIADGDSYTFGEPGSTSTLTGYREERVGGNVKWETSYRQNLGVELNFLKNNLQLIAEFFKERREGILLPNYVIPYVSGFTGSNIPYSNIGKTRNEGIDLTLEYDKRWTANKFLSFRGTLTCNKNVDVFDGLPPWNYPWLDRIGHSIDQRFGYTAIGYFTSQEEIDNAPQQSGDVRPGDIRYKDLNDDGIINANDESAIGYGSTPRMVYGLSLSGGLANFDLSLFFQGVGLVDFNYTSGFGTTPFPEGATYGNMYTQILNRWTPENPDQSAFYPRLSTNQDATTNYYTSTHWIKRADYLRLKQAELGYSFTGKVLLKKFALSKLRLFLSGTNLFTLSPWKFWDPELGDGRGTVYPNISTYNFGIRANFK